MDKLKVKEKKLKELLERKNSKNKKILFVCIGSDACIGDSVGPLIGSMLKEKGYTDVLGTLNNNVNAKNIKSSIKQIKERYPNHFIIAIDACITDEEKNMNNFYITDRPISPGKGLGLNLSTIGHASIKCMIMHQEDYNEIYEATKSCILALNTIRINKVYTISKEVVKVIENVIPIK